MNKTMNDRLCTRLLAGARGDLKLGFDGCFRFAAHGDLAPALVTVTHEQGLTLTADGGQFILENLWADKTEHRAIKKLWDAEKDAAAAAHLAKA